jgi:hypothetical protein
MSQVPLQPVINSARLEEGTVEYVDADKEGRTFIYVRCDNRKIHPKNLPLHSLTRCYPVNLFGGATSKTPVNPPEGTKCLIMFKNPGSTPKDFLQGYYIGALEQKSESIPINQDVKAAQGSLVHKTDKGSGMNLSGSSSKASIFSNKSHVTVEDESVKIGNGISSMNIGNNGFQIQSFDSKQQPIGVFAMSSANIFMKSEGGIVLGAQAGEVTIIGDGTSIQNTSIFSVTTRSAEISASDTLSFSSAQRVETIGGNPLLAFIPTPSYQIKIVSGGYSLGVAVGDIAITASNPLTYNTITIRNGQSIGLFESSLKLGAFQTTLKQRSTALISKLEMGLGMATLASKLILNLQSGSIFISSDVMISIKTSMFILQAGTVIPNPAAPYLNLLPSCAFTGMPHGGNVSVG